MTDSVITATERRMARWMRRAALDGEAFEPTCDDWERARRLAWAAIGVHLPEAPPCQVRHARPEGSADGPL